ncbi:MAG: 1-acyl-sn-glycerol-3-phosphate acyltransferase, partial [Pirellulales bacterium]|nr:1-acyl-sn-glycerol-3-phosphate acyltransferase [Pirellulales bacterium]
RCRSGLALTKAISIWAIPSGQALTYEDSPLPCMVLRDASTTPTNPHRTPMFSHQTTNLIAAFALAGLLTALGIWVLSFMRRVNYTPMQLALYSLNEFMTHFVWRATVEGSLPTAEGHGAVIVSNHRSSFDPCFVQMVSNYRKVHWMVAGEYFKHPIMGTALRALEAIPTGRRGIDTAATKQAIRYTESGDLVGMFPEGRINTTDELMLPGRPGAILVALMAGMPIVPCYIDGSPQKESVFASFMTPTRVRMKIGTPIDLAPYAGHEREHALLRQLTYDIMKAIAELAGQPDFEPQLAGRKWLPDEEKVDRPSAFGSMPEHSP